MAFVNQTAQFIRALLRVWQHKIGFAAVALLVFSVSVGTLASLDLLPEPATKTVVTSSKNTVIATSTPAAPELPLRIEIPSIKLAASNANPDTTEVAKLDAALEEGAVRYPTSAKLGTEGNVIVFGHSSYLPIVNNKAYKAFNEIQNLSKDDRINVIGETTTFVYAVESVRSADAGKDGIPLTVTGSVLTLATCDSFGTPSDRFIVTARLVESYPNAS